MIKLMAAESEVWKMYKLGNFADVQGGFAFSSSDFTDSGTPVIKIKNIVPPRVLLNEIQFYGKQVDKRLEAYWVRKGDILISMTGSTVNQMSSAVGKIGRYKYEQPALLNQRVGKVFVKDPKALDDNYLYYFLARDEIQYILALNATGSANQANISPTQIKNLDILLPPLSVQRRIGDILSALDDKIECNRRISQTLEVITRALYTHLFVNAAEKETQPLTDLIDIDPTVRLTRGAETTYVDMKSLPTNSMSVTETTRRRFNSGSKFQNGDTLFARITPCLENGKTAFVDFLEDGEAGFGSTEFIVLRAKEGISPQFVYCCARDEHVRAHAIKSIVGTSGRQRVRSDCFSRYFIKKVHPEAMQYFDEQTALWFKQIRLNVKDSQTLAQTRDYLLPKLLSGEIEVNVAEEQMEALV